MSVLLSVLSVCLFLSHSPLRFAWLSPPGTLFFVSCVAVLAFSLCFFFRTRAEALRPTGGVGERH